MERLFIIFLLCNFLLPFILTPSPFEATPLFSRREGPGVSGIY
jgi:hypothetical protein